MTSITSYNYMVCAKCKYNIASRCNRINHNYMPMYGNRICRHSKTCRMCLCQIKEVNICIS